MFKFVSQDAVNEVDIRPTISQIIAQLDKTQYSESVSTEKYKRCVRVREHSNTPNPASDSDTSQG